ncbi:MAG: hypothetical protein KDB07_05190, partial [Planctomycetes bacterium]|nr:hypothetical protein [Planctomycetota bacterium]
IVEKAWGGKDMAWPEMLDTESTTTNAYGVPGYPGLVIIDPEGNVHQTGHFIFDDFKKIVDDVKVGKEIPRAKAEVKEEPKEDEPKKDASK